MSKWVRLGELREDCSLVRDFPIVHVYGVGVCACTCIRVQVFVSGQLHASTLLLGSFGIRNICLLNLHNKCD